MGLNEQDETLTFNRGAYVIDNVNVKWEISEEARKINFSIHLDSTKMYQNVTKNILITYEKKHNIF